eukprot:366566-Chlamydomonas_euryale.AAC.15
MAAGRTSWWLGRDFEAPCAARAAAAHSPACPVCSLGGRLPAPWVGAGHFPACFVHSLPAAWVGAGHFPACPVYSPPAAWAGAGHFPACFVHSLPAAWVGAGHFPACPVYSPPAAWAGAGRWPHEQRNKCHHPGPSLSQQPQTQAYNLHTPAR